MWLGLNAISTLPRPSWASCHWARKGRPRSQGSPSLAQKAVRRGYQRAHLKLCLLAEDSRTRGQTGRKGGRGGRFDVLVEGIGVFLFSSARKKKVEMASPAVPSLLEELASSSQHPALCPTTPTPPSLSPGDHDQIDGEPIVGQRGVRSWFSRTTLSQVTVRR